jgi:hypothetical protein
LNKQNRAFSGLLQDVQMAPRYQQVILRWLAEREGQKFDLKAICRYCGVAFNTVYNNPPLEFIERGILNRTGRGQKAIYWSRLESFLVREFPDLNHEELVNRLLKVLPALR